MISKKTKYALKALISLAEEHSTNRPVLISELSQRNSIPKKFLELILLELKNKGFLASKKGKGGGYFLAKAPESISLGSLIRVLDGPLAPIACVSQTAYRKCSECVDEAHCGLRTVMMEVRESTARILDSTSLKDVLERSGQTLEMYHI